MADLRCAEPPPFEVPVHKANIGANRRASARDVIRAIKELVPVPRPAPDLYKIGSIAVAGLTQGGVQDQFADRRLFAVEVLDPPLFPVPRGGSGLPSRVSISQK